MTRWLRLFRYALLVGLAAISSQTNAVDNIQFDGFVSVGGGWFNGEDHTASYRGYDQDFQSDPVTKFGLQVSAEVNEQITATGQLLAKGSNDYKVEAEWAYLSYAVNEDWDIRAGRLLSPFFLYSDYINVGYSLPWIEPPKEVYRYDFNTLEGFDTLYRTYLGEWDTSLQVYYGRLDDTLELSGEEVDMDIRNFSGVNVTFNRDWLTLRAAYNYSKFTIESPAELADLLAVLPAEVAAALQLEKETGIFYGLALGIDYQDWLLTSEYTLLDIKDPSIASSDDAWYLMLGRRFDEMTLHMTYTEQESDPDYSILDSMPDGPLKAGARAAIAATKSSALTLGLRYDFSTATALKVEATQVEFDHSNTDGTLINFSIDTVF